MIKRFWQYLTEKTSIIVYKSFILPLLEYGNTLYMSANKNLLDRLQVLQNVGLKTCLNLPKRTPTSQIHKLCNINYLTDRRDAALLKLMFNRTKIEKFQDKNQEGVTTRSRNAPKLIIPSFKSSHSQNSIVYKGSKMWNEQNVETKNTTEKLKYNTVIKKLLCNKRENYTN